MIPEFETPMVLMQAHSIAKAGLGLFVYHFSKVEWHGQDYHAGCCERPHRAEEGRAFNRLVRRRHDRIAEGSAQPPDDQLGRPGGDSSSSYDPMRVHLADAPNESLKRDATRMRLAQDGEVREAIQG